MELYQNLDMLRRLKLKTAGTKTGRKKKQSSCRFILHMVSTKQNHAVII